MANNSTFSISIPNLEKLQAALNQAPEIAKTRLNQAIHLVVYGPLTTATTKDNIPWRTGNLTLNWRKQFGDLQAIYNPTMEYAPYVEFGTKPHVIMAKNKKALFWEGADHPVRKVNHPGTKANPFMERIVAAAKPETDKIFEQSLNKITQEIANKAA